MPSRHGRRASLLTNRAHAGAPRAARADTGRCSILLSIALLMLGWAAAQSTPVIALNTNRLEVGGTLTLEATLLRPQAPYVFELAAPDGSSTSTQISSNASGNLRASQVLDQAGRWSATLVGPGIEATFWVEVTPAPGTPAVDTPRERSTTPAAPLPDAPPASKLTPPNGSENPAGAENPAGDEPPPATNQPGGGDVDPSGAVRDDAEGGSANQPDQAGPDQTESDHGDTPSAGARESDGLAVEQPGAPTPGAQDGQDGSGNAAAGGAGSQGAENGAGGPGADDHAAEGGTPEQAGTPSQRTPNGAGPGTPHADQGERPGGGQEPFTPPQDAITTPGGSGSDTLRPGGEEAAPSPPASTALPLGPDRTLQVTLDGGSAVASLDGTETWRLDFPASGETVGPAMKDGTVYLGHGNSLLAIDAATGVVTTRWAMPAQVSDVQLDGDTVAIRVRYLDGDEGRILLAAGGLSETVRFGADPALFGLLRREAAVDDPAARLAQDPTNPWLYVRLAAEAATAEEAASHYRAAIEHASTFYDAAQLSRVMQGDDLPELANDAMEKALRDFEARGYRPELLTDSTLRDAYGFPLSVMEAAVARGDLPTAGFWAPWVYALSTPAVPETQAALRHYADALRAAGQRDESSLWRARSAEGGGFRIGQALESSALTLGRNGWYGVAALLVAIVALHVTLLAKYWRPQSLALRQRHEAGHRSLGAPRVLAMRYYSLTEKVVLVLMFAAVLALAAMAGWAHRGDDLPDAWRSGTLSSVPARSALATRLPDPAGASSADGDRVVDAPSLPADTASDPASTTAASSSGPGVTAEVGFVRGYAAHMAGDRRAAEEAYLTAGDLPGALNNLGILRDDSSLIQRAADLRPQNRVARFNLGRDTDPSPFHAAYGGDTPLLAVPSTADLRAALAGSVQSSLGAAFTNPWAALTRTNPLATPAWLWAILVVVFLLAAAVTILGLLVPRPRLARNAPRTPIYHVLALLLPGTGLSDELWGVLLLVPWAIFGVDALLHLLPGGVAPTMPLETDYAALGILYALNLVAFIVEFVSYRRRMRDLRHEFPDTARAYGMRVSSSAG